MSTSSQVLPATSSPRSKRAPFALLMLWFAVFASAPIAMLFVTPGWDAAVYRNAIRSIEAGHDPYVDSATALKSFYSQPVRPAGDSPFNYVYSPITLPLFSLVRAVPAWFSSSLYWFAYMAGVVAVVWVATLAFEESERPYLLYFAPVSIYFPGLVANGIVLGGNVAYILYGAVLLAAAYGWKRGTWIWFYLAVLVASCFKAPLLSLIVLPCFSARRQWLAAGISAVAGVALFAATRAIWPELFQHYLQSIQLQLDLNRDFGCSPSGLLADALRSRGMPYSRAATLFYVSYAAPTVAILFYVSRRFLRGEFSLKQWMPVLLSGVILLNPRVIEYDLYPLTLLFALIAWRFLAAFARPFYAVLWLALLFVAMNALALGGWEAGKLVRGAFFILSFVAGCWTLLRPSIAAAGAASCNGLQHE